MTRSRLSGSAYWLLAAVFAMGLASASIGALDDLYPTHWRYSLWWLAILGTHLARLPIVIMIWCAFFFDMFDPIMSSLYGAQGGALLFLGFPFYILALLIYVWRRGEYRKFAPDNTPPKTQN